ncbi:hypothetical protein OH764_21400 [Burkholderia sp. M6-3]|jgi:hypothetical protein
MIDTAGGTNVPSADAGAPWFDAPPLLLDPDDPPFVPVDVALVWVLAGLPVVAGVPLLPVPAPAPFEPGAALLVTPALAVPPALPPEPPPQALNI